MSDTRYRRSRGSVGACKIPNRGLCSLRSLSSDTSRSFRPVRLQVTPYILIHLQAILFVQKYHGHPPGSLKRLPLDRAAECISAFQIKCTRVSTVRGLHRGRRISAVRLYSFHEICREAARMRALCAFFSSSSPFFSPPSILSVPWEYTYSASGVPESTMLACLTFFSPLGVLPCFFLPFSLFSFLNPPTQTLSLPRRYLRAKHSYVIRTSCN